MIELQKWNTYLNWSSNPVNFENPSAIKKPMHILEFFFLSLCTFKILSAAEIQRPYVFSIYRADFSIRHSA